MKTAWGRRCQRRLALVEGADVIASAEQYDAGGGIRGPGGPCLRHWFGFHRNVPSRPASRADLLEALLDRAAQAGAEMALLFLSPARRRRAGRLPGDPIDRPTLHVAESPRYGAPMTMVAGGEERDLAAITAMGRVRAEPVPLSPRSRRRIRSVRHDEKAAVRRSGPAGRTPTAFLHR